MPTNQAVDRISEPKAEVKRAFEKQANTSNMQVMQLHSICTDRLLFTGAAATPIEHCRGLITSTSINPVQNIAKARGCALDSICSKCFRYRNASSATAYTLLI